jgi:hypothetical protein
MYHAKYDKKLVYNLCKKFSNEEIVLRVVAIWRDGIKIVFSEMNFEEVVWVELA